MNNIKDVIYCKECPNCEFYDCIEQYYCEKYRVEIEDIAHDFCELELDELD